MQILVCFLTIKRHLKLTFAGTFLIKNYNQALEILDTEIALKFAMDQAGVSEQDMEDRLAQEKAYLDKLSKEPQVETEQMEYYKQLVNLAAKT